MYNLKLFLMHRLERQKTELEKERIVKMRSEPDGKRVSHNKAYIMNLIMATHRMTQMVKMDLLENHVCTL